VVDDAHLLDDASATLIHQLAGSDSAFVLATLRTGEVAPEPVTSLWKDGVVERLELVGLDARAVAQLLESVLRGPVDRATVAHLAVRCQGNVLFLRELVLGALHDGSLCDDGGIWRLVAPLCPSERLVELVEARLGRLDGAERRLLELVSFGEPLGPAGLRAVAERLATAAIEAGAGFDAELLAAQLACLEGRAEEAHNRLSVLAGKATDDAQRGLVAVSDLDALAIYTGRMDEGLRVAEEAESA